MRLALFVGCAAPAFADDIVRAADYDAYWLWAGVRARADLDHARIIYLLQGEIGAGADGVVYVKAQGGASPSAHRQTLWLVYRVRSLDWPPSVLQQVIDRYKAWRAAPGEIAGIQIDFDASTRGLSRYAEFLRRLRADLPEGCRLSVTGLMDWASRGEPEDLDALAGAVDEIVFQTYRGRTTVENIAAYVARLDRVKTPFRLGLAEGANWPSEGLELPANFLGYVVFLRNPR